METISFWIWLISVVAIVGIGLGAMVFAYWGKGSVAVVFPEPIVSEPLEPSENASGEASENLAVAAFQRGCEAYRQGQFRRAIDGFSAAIQQNPELAEAYHNRGRAIANLRRVTDALVDLVKASELYLQQGNSEKFAQLKQDLATLKGEA